jgi:Flp pilus assembly CpaF family ATPase
MEEEAVLHDTRHDLRAIWANRRGSAPALGETRGPAALQEQRSIYDQAVDEVMDRMAREHADLLSKDIIGDVYAQLRIKTLIAQYAQETRTVRLTQTEIDHVRRRCEGKMFLLGDLAEILNDPDVLEIQMVSTSGVQRATSRRRSRPYAEDPAVRFAPGTDPVKELQHFAGLYGTKLDASTPYATFMAGPWRVSIHIPPHVMHDFTLTMRRGVDDTNTPTREQLLAHGTVDETTLGLLYAIVDSFQTAVIFAPQRSGKTFLQTHLINHIDPNDGNTVLIQDIVEITPTVPVMSMYAVSRPESPIDMRTLSAWSLRESAVRVVVGEIRLWETVALMDTAQQGTGALATGHATSPLEMTHRLVDTYLHTTENITDAVAFRKVHSAIDFYIEMQRFEGPRRKESFRVRGIYELLPTEGVVTERDFRPIILYRHEGFDRKTGEEIGHHEVVNPLSPDKYEAMLLRSSYKVRVPEAVRPKEVATPTASPADDAGGGVESIELDLGEGTPE